MAGAGTIPVYRESGNAATAVKAAVAAVEGGEAVWVYPEGTITRDPDLWPMSGKTGAARIALESGAPVIPVAHWGVQKLMGPYKIELNLVPRKTIHVLAGPPVDLDDLRDKPITDVILQEATTRILDTVADMLGELRGEEPPKDRWTIKAGKRLPPNRGLPGGAAKNPRRKAPAKGTSPIKGSTATKSTSAASKARPKGRAVTRTGTGKN